MGNTINAKDLHLKWEEQLIVLSFSQHHIHIDVWINGMATPKYSDIVIAKNIGPSSDEDMLPVMQAQVSSSAIFDVRPMLPHCLEDSRDTKAKGSLLK
ncbi:hypothetical protein V6N11_046742 [Hibiscus sabdariffa]|uniref:C2 domain-containing protein n=1 Tax=Hibiscus sabdariffa TaxID=183260 RepID=A0ABR2NGI1_9ROSI